MKVITEKLGFTPALLPDWVCRPEEMLFFDIETTGLRKETTQLYLIGCACLLDGTWTVKQWLTENLYDEYYVLEEFLEFASGFRYLMHFNGDRFDIPYLQYKCEYYATGTDLSGFQSYDIYARIRAARNLLGGGSLSQKSLECLMGIDRDDQLDGGRLIPVYYEYEKTRAAELEKLLLLHNYDDIQGMLKILPMISFGSMFEGEFSFERMNEEKPFVCFQYHLDHPLPLSAEVFLDQDTKGRFRICDGTREPSVCIRAEDESLQIRFRSMETTGCFPLKPVSDYYYVPELDSVIHKDVASFLDRSKRQKATAANCMIRKSGQFLPLVAEGPLRTFYHTENRKIALADCEELTRKMKKDPEQISQYLKKTAMECLQMIMNVH